MLSPRIIIRSLLHILCAHTLKHKAMLLCLVCSSLEISSTALIDIKISIISPELNGMLLIDDEWSVNSLQGDLSLLAQGVTFKDAKQL